MKDRIFFSSAVCLILIFSGAGRLCAQQLWSYSRPNPLMDYVAQEMGAYDTVYEELNEADCRSCHGGSLAEKHHETDRAATSPCTPCHLTGPVITDCLTSGCHSSDDVLINGWHHNTEASDSGNCGSCHDLVPVEEFGPGIRFEDDPPTVNPPTPYSCENCHWEEANSATEDPDNPGHPSTLDHYDDWGQYVGFYEYGKPTDTPFDTHHMGFRGNIVNNKCYACHGFGFDWETAEVSWDPENRERIRHCERCHTKASLHQVHDRDCYSCEAVGFHVGEDYEEGEAAPDTERLFTYNEMCSGCHASIVTLAPAANPSILWPPNHDMVDIIIETNAYDKLGSPVTLTAVVTSNEPIDGLGDGDVAPDWTQPVIDQGAGTITLQLRAERSESGHGREYSIAITATDWTGWPIAADVKITVPEIVIALLDPEDGAVLSKRQRPVFKWDSPDYESFQVQFSKDPDFQSWILTLPLGKAEWLSGTSYTPTKIEWWLLRLIGRRSDRIYWRVKGKDGEENTAFSEMRDFTIEQRQLPRWTRWR
ncbi:MAG: hypothetical protein JRJ47_05305 [Deltaproteobacteria bacterium]|nr:hypothetical protein [Deltaproteobacteria bacterium]